MKRIAIAAVLGALAACSNEQWYQSTQDLRCQQYHKEQDPYYQGECPKESYGEYRRKRAEAMQQKPATEKPPADTEKNGKN